MSNRNAADEGGLISSILTVDSNNGNPALCGRSGSGRSLPFSAVDVWEQSLLCFQAAS